jgi:N-glycosylase/DNA lyase
MDVFKQVGIPRSNESDKESDSLLWPATKDEILRQARRKGVPEEVINRLEKLPDKIYKNIGEVIKAAGGE